MWPQLIGLLGGALGQQQPQRTNIDPRRQYWMQLMQSLNPEFAMSNPTRQQTSSGPDTDLASLVNLLSGQKNYNPFFGNSYSQYGPTAQQGPWSMPTYRDY